MCNDCRLRFIHNIVALVQGVKSLHFGDSTALVGFIDMNILEVDWLRKVQLCVCMCVYIHVHYRMDGWYVGRG